MASYSELQKGRDLKEIKFDTVQKQKKKKMTGKIDFCVVFRSLK